MWCNCDTLLAVKECKLYKSNSQVGTRCTALNWQPLLKNKKDQYVNNLRAKWTKSKRKPVKNLREHAIHMTECKLYTVKPERAAKSNGQVSNHCTALTAPRWKDKGLSGQEEAGGGGKGGGGASGSQEVIAESRNEMMAGQFIRDAPNKLN